MRFPLSLTWSTVLHLFKNKLARNKRFPLVLMLEPLHACNLHCVGCGRIREYADSLNQRMSLDDCRDAARACPAPIVSICGGEPLIYPEIVELVDDILKQGKHIYLCTNGQILEEKLDSFVQLAKKNRRVRGHMYWNVHLDGLAATHDAIVGKPGAFDKAFAGMTAAKKAGFYVYTNTTLYKTVLKTALRPNTIDELVELCSILSTINVDGMMMAPGYGYEAVTSETVTGNEESFFLTRTETQQVFRQIREKLKQFRLTTTPIFMDFLCGERELPCAAWANPTRNVRGWKSPCYLITDKHAATYREFLEQTDWQKIGPGNDVRCEHCLMHCGFEPAAVLYGNRLRDLLRMAFWQFS